MSWINSQRRMETQIRWELHKNATWCFDQILETTLHKAAVVRPLTSHLTNHPNKINRTHGTLLEKWGRTHEQCFLIVSYTWTCQHWLTSRHINSVDIGCSLEDLPWVMDDGDRWWERVGGTLCCWWDLIILSNFILLKGGGGLKMLVRESFH